MIPRFPNFKELQLSDQNDVQNLTRDFAPYSHFSFASLLLWSDKTPNLVSNLNGNLVARLPDIYTSNAIYTFIGLNDCNESVLTLLTFLQDSKSAAELHLIPEVTVERLDLNSYDIQEDRDSFDYVFCTKELSEMSGGKFADLRNRARFFEKRDTTFLNLDLAETRNQQKILQCFKSWTENHDGMLQVSGTTRHAFLDVEELAFEKLLATPELLISSSCYSLFVDGVLVAFLLGEHIRDYFLCHFHKSNLPQKGTMPLLFRQTARVLRDSGVRYINYEEDLGLKGLRFFKSRYRPVTFLKKYTVSLKPSKNRRNK